MEATIKIQNLDELLQLFFKCNLEVINYTTKRLTAAGENYGSLMLQVEVTLKLEDINKSSEERSFNFVAKMCPPNEWLKKVFNTAVTFKREIALYQTMLPLLKSLQAEQGVLNVIDFIPECYGARISLDYESDVVDDDAIILLENLKLQRYQMMDRMQGLNLDTASLLLRNLAVFHAVPIAFKLLKPDIFKKEFLPHLSRLCVYDNLSKEAAHEMINAVIKTAEADEKCVPFLPRAKKCLLDCLGNIRNLTQIREPFGTIIHNDFWVNNAMLILEGNRPVKCKMVDFQLMEYGSPGNDIVFFLFTSVKKEVLDLHYDDLIKLYYETFIKTLKDLQCDFTPFTYKLFEEEVNTSAKTLQFLHIMCMLRPIFALKGAVKEMHEFSEEELLREDAVSDEYKRKVPEMILEFAKRDWI